MVYQQVRRYLLLAAFLMLAGGAVTAGEAEGFRSIDFSKETPSGTIEVKATSMRLLVGGNWGSGTLHFQGETYPFKVKGLSAGGVGVSSIDAVGDVYFLNKPEDLSGTFRVGTIGTAVGEGAGTGTFENGNGVVLRVKAKTTGVALLLGTGGMSIRMGE